MSKELKRRILMKDCADFLFGVSMTIENNELKKVAKNLIQQLNQEIKEPWKSFKMQ